MILRFVRLCLLLGVILGIALPKFSAALAGIGIIDSAAVLICGAHGLERLEPPAAPLHDDHQDADDPLCLLVHALDRVDLPALPAAIRLARSLVPADVRQALSDRDLIRTRFARAPPRA